MKVPQPNQVVADRKLQFDDINDYVTARDSWVVSVRGDREVRLECLPDSPVAEELRTGAAFKRGGNLVKLPPYDVREDGEGQRILADAIVERFTTRAGGTIGETRTHAGIVKTRRFSFDLP